MSLMLPLRPRAHGAALACCCGLGGAAAAPVAGYRSNYYLETCTTFVDMHQEILGL